LQDEKEHAILIMNSQRVLDLPVRAGQGGIVINGEP
jgi:hypothetical protein